MSGSTGKPQDCRQTVWPGSGQMKIIGTRTELVAAGKIGAETSGPWRSQRVSEIPKKYLVQGQSFISVAGRSYLGYQ